MFAANAEGESEIAIIVAPIAAIVTQSLTLPADILLEITKNAIPNRTLPPITPTLNKTLNRYGFGISSNLNI